MTYKYKYSSIGKTRHKLIKRTKNQDGGPK